LPRRHIVALGIDIGVAHLDRIELVAADAAAEDLMLARRSWIPRIGTSTFSLRPFDRPRIPALAANRPHRIFTEAEVLSPRLAALDASRHRHDGRKIDIPRAAQGLIARGGYGDRQVS
jgi:hypothetical protein